MFASTRSPGLMPVRVQPKRTSTLGLVISSSHSVGSSPALTVPKTRRLTCGLTQRNSLTVPVTASVLHPSNMVPEWCADTFPTPAINIMIAAMALDDLIVGILIADIVG